MLLTEYMEMMLFWSPDRLSEQCPPKHLYALVPTYPADYVCFHMKCFNNGRLFDITLAEHLKKKNLSLLETTE